jgi:hypothetical protein
VFQAASNARGKNTGITRNPLRKRILFYDVEIYGPKIGRREKKLAMEAIEPVYKICISKATPIVENAALMKVTKEGVCDSAKFLGHKVVPVAMIVAYSINAAQYRDEYKKKHPNCTEDAALQYTGTMIGRDVFYDTFWLNEQGAAWDYISLTLENTIMNWPWMLQMRQACPDMFLDGTVNSSVDD